MSRRFKPTTIKSSQVSRAQILANNRAAARERRNRSRYRNEAGVRSIVGMRQMGEKKGMDTELALNPIIDTTNTNASSFSLNLIRPGTASYNRVGRKISMRSLRLRGFAQLEVQGAVTSGDYAGNVLRMVVVYDKQPSGAVPAFDTIFGHTDQAGTESSIFLDAVKYDNMGRFQILKDVVIQMNPEAGNTTGGTTDTIQQTYPFDEYVKLGGRETVFSGQSSPCTIADVSTGGLYVFFRTATNLTTSFVALGADSVARLRYTD